MELAKHAAEEVGRNSSLILGFAIHTRLPRCLYCWTSRSRNASVQRQWLRLKNRFHPPEPIRLRDLEGQEMG